MKVELKALTIDQIKEILGQNNLRGISNAEEWENARPVTLAGIIYEALSNHPEILWMVPAEDKETGVISADAIRADVLKAPIENMPLHKSMQEAAEEFARELKEGLEAVDVDSQKVEEAAECETEDSATAEPESADEDLKEAEPENTEKNAESKLGKWEDYKGKALSTLEQNLIIKGMKEEGFSLAMICSVVRLSQPTISNRIKKMRLNGEMEETE